MTTSRPIERCQVCESPELESVLHLGSIPPVNTMPELGSVDVESTQYPLELLRCNGCSLVHIGIEVDPEVLFPPSYPYRSATTRILRDNFADLARECSDLIGVGAGHLVVDVGSNDGTLLSNFASRGCTVLGVEPSLAAEDAVARSIPTRMEFFSPRVAAEIAADVGKAQVVTAANVFAHIGDIAGITQAIAGLLSDDGVFVSESHYLPALVETLQYDTVYHEHLRYYSLESLSNLLGAAGLEVFFARAIPTHGGSIRVYAGRKGQREVTSSVREILDAERASGISDGTALPTFRRRVTDSKLRLMELIAPLFREGARIYGIGAPSRASTLINYVGLDHGMIDCVLEVTGSAKIGHYIPGTRIPVLDETKLFEDQPEFALLLSWHIADELVENLRRKGFTGKYIVPLPEPRLIDG